MRTDQVLALIGGILGVAIVPVVLASAISSTEADVDSVAGVAMVGSAHIVSIVIFALASISAIIVAFTVKTPRITGYVLIGLASTMIVISNVTGAVSWVLLLVGGIIAVKYGDRK
ncbi:MAG: hypothetical protein D9C04_06795 [Nitrosopumilus sp. B06]|nr:MAG: hypothetical protein EB828_01200 [Nitrosopumilus sp. D6]RNJ78688.1 MAG: hypothetical protein D9C04_06795 [Nitrosopumilus sp. B06]